MKSQAGVKAKVEKFLKPIFVEAKELLQEVENVQQAISNRAYEFFEKRDKKVGSELQDWFLAESQVLRHLPVEIEETDKGFIVTAQVSGFNPEDIKISVEPHRIIISGKFERKEEKKEKNKVVSSEMHSNQFLRTIRLPRTVITEKADAKLKDGLLVVTVPKLAFPLTDEEQIEDTQEIKPRAS